MGRPDDYPVGSKSAYGYNGQTHYKMVSGTWMEIDPSCIPLSEIPDNSPVSRMGGSGMKAVQHMSVPQSFEHAESRAVQQGEGGNRREESKVLLPVGVRNVAVNRSEERLAMGRIAKERLARNRQRLKSVRRSSVLIGVLFWIAKVVLVANAIAQMYVGNTSQLSLKAVSVNSTEPMMTINGEQVSLLGNVVNAYDYEKTAQKYFRLFDAAVQIAIASLMGVL